LIARRFSSVERGVLHSGLGREFSFRYPAHRWIAGLTVAAGATAWLVGLGWQRLSLGPALQLAFSVAGGNFLAWTLGRELDPDHPGAAFVGALMAVPLGIVAGGVGLLLGAWQLLFLRLVNRSTGVAVRPLESLVLVGLTLWLGWSIHPIIGLLATAALLADGSLREGNGAHLIVGGTLGFFSLIWLLWLGPNVLRWPATVWLAAGLLSAGVFVGWALRQGPPASRADLTGRPLGRRRVLAAQVLAVLIGLGLLFALGPDGMWQSVPLWATMVGVWLAALVRWGKRANHEDAKDTKGA
jgi:hypothetical protein